MLSAIEIRRLLGRKLDVLCICSADVSIWGRGSAKDTAMARVLASQNLTFWRSEVMFTACSPVPLRSFLLVLTFLLRKKKYEEPEKSGLNFKLKLFFFSCYLTNIKISEMNTFSLMIFLYEYRHSHIYFFQIISNQIFTRLF